MDAQKVISRVETGATLESTTAVGGNESIHKGNMGAELQANTLGGKPPADWDRTTGSGIDRHHEINMLGLRAWYPFVLGGGSTAYDMSTVGGTSQGTINGATWVTGRDGPALDFDGASDYVNLGDNSNLSITGPFSFVGWVYIRSHMSALTTWANGNFNYYPWHIVTTTNSKIRYNNSSTASVDSTDSLSTSQWVHVGITLDDSLNVRFYFDGVADSGNPKLVDGFANNGDQFAALGRSDTQYLDGMMDDARIYARTLPQTEIKDIMNGVA